MRINLRQIVLVTASFFLLNTASLAAFAHAPISHDEVVQTERKWADGIVDIGRQFLSGGDFRTVAADLIDNLYGYSEGTVLFKPTKASEDQFRETADQALSYFVGGDNPEDAGFAIQPWSSVRFENNGIFIDSDSATAMGNYYFTDAKTGKEVKVEFTMQFRRADDGHLKIVTHHSSLPYQRNH
ncbi:phosphoribosyl-AMP cyclohydrolase [Pannonibacter sp. SL95]|uniref:phosphoribosyl-AMP cyclohydrolase n=1 Tax=Pannonibacter sp. SL95 TaxID=2995153 RepID=UPI0022735947|nr:phosphoribosyl-AMP cyclohydrolase [Pannonibacter sp. SL95]MCY1708992.1 phosphoribosyl-AMP cyclohydrolase [Pannonibacter sp. SL95]